MSAFKFKVKDVVVILDAFVLVNDTCHLMTHKIIRTTIIYGGKKVYGLVSRDESSYELGVDECFISLFSRKMK